MSEIDTEQAARDFIDEFNPAVNIADNTFDASRVLEELDPIAFHQYELDLIDSNIKGGDWFEWDDESIHDEPEDDDNDEPHTGHRSQITGTWFCDTCNSPYCELA